MKVYHLLSMIFLVVIGTFIVSSAVIADEVSYDEIDYNALSVSAQSQQPQAADQFAKIYRQVLIFDENNYGTSYNQDMLEASLFAGSAVLALDDGELTLFRLWLAVGSSLALEELGYAEGTEKMSALRSSNSALGSAHKTTLGCVWDAVKGLVLCIIGFPPNMPLLGKLGKKLLGKHIVDKIGPWIARLPIPIPVRVAARWIFYKLAWPLTLACATAVLVELVRCIFGGILIKWAGHMLRKSDKFTVQHPQKDYLTQVGYGVQL